MSVAIYLLLTSGSLLFCTSFPLLVSKQTTVFNEVRPAVIAHRSSSAKHSNVLDSAFRTYSLMFITTSVDKSLLSLFPLRETVICSHLWPLSQMYYDICSGKLFVCLGRGTGPFPRFVDFNNGVIQGSGEGGVGALQVPGNTHHCWQQLSDSTWTSTSAKMKANWPFLCITSDGFLLLYFTWINSISGSCQVSFRERFRAHCLSAVP